MAKVSIIAAVLVFIVGIIFAFALPGATEGFRYFLVIASFLGALLAALSVEESLPTVRRFFR